MKRFPKLLVVLIFAGSLCGSVGYAQKQNARVLFARPNLLAWCIVPFDSKHRSPAERVEMLKRLKFSQYAYDWRHDHLDSFAAEIELAKKSNIVISAVWLWIDKDADKPGQLSADNERMLTILKQSGLKTQIWVGFNSNYFQGIDDAANVDAGADMIRYLAERTALLATRIGLYNHGDWFGNPVNQLKIIQVLNDPGIGIVYNFHHAHAQIDRFPSLMSVMKPHLLAVNIDGMRRSGPQILTVGSGDEEKAMLQELLMSGYTGPIGILGHIETEDVEVVLKRNLDGLRKLVKIL